MLSPRGRPLATHRFERNANIRTRGTRERAESVPA